MIPDDELRSWIDKWLNRAALAFKNHNVDLSRQALLKAWDYQNEMAKRGGLEAPDQPADPELFFRTWTPAQLHEAAGKTLPDILEYKAQRAIIEKYAALASQDASSENNKAWPDYMEQALQAIEQYRREKDNTQPAD